MDQPGRPREFDPVEALSQIMQLFWEHGYEATGLSDIMAATGLGKASLYATYGNKKEIYLKALAHYEGLMVDAAVSILRARERPPRERIGAFLSAPIVSVRDHADRRGCFLCNASADRASLDRETSEMVLRGYAKMRAALVDALRQISPDAAPTRIEARAELVLTVYSGLRVMARAGTPVEALSMAMDAAIDALEAE